MTSETTSIAWRGAAVCCALANAVVHLLLVPDHLEEMFYVGVLFLVGSVIMLAAGAGIALSARPVVAWLVGAAVSLGMIVGFVLSRTVGLPGYHEQGMEPPYGALALIAEAGFLLAFAGWLASTRAVPDMHGAQVRVAGGGSRAAERSAPHNRVPGTRG
ncbi:hypothetical protein ACWCP6_26035 [Streptomyces sp. NPDC002004]